MFKLHQMKYIEFYKIRVALLGLVPPVCQNELKGNLKEEIKQSSEKISDFTITVIYDNNEYKQGLEAAWGFSCLVSGTEKTILFDTGGDGELLMRNMGKLNIDPETVDAIVLSHIHGDHVGGLKTVLAANSNVDVYVPKSFPEDFKKSIEKYGAQLVDVHEPSKICENVYSTGELGVAIKEQSLVIHTEKGLVVITGCAHPGIVKIIGHAKNMIKDEVLFVMGGFHLGSTSKKQIKTIISGFNNLGVHNVAPCHCSGDNARDLFEQEFQQHCINVTVGRVIKMDEFK
jgi:7,8-dihydropterin-6-yl-methyl-4-(beta-D-ribofuranosyl)aminobenzene 5'-phosphate synthase